MVEKGRVSLCFLLNVICTTGDEILSLFYRVLMEPINDIQCHALPGSPRFVFVSNLIIKQCVFCSIVV